MRTAAVTRALARQRNRKRMVEFLDAVGTAVGRDREVRAVLRDLGGDPVMQQQLKNGEQMRQQQIDPDQMVRAQDLQRMLDMIENLAKQGSRDAAQEMLAQLENILKNLRPGVAQQGQQQNNSPMSQMLQQLGEMMRRQQELMDKTFQMPEGFEGRNQQGQRGQQGQQESTGEESAERAPHARISPSGPLWSRSRSAKSARPKVSRRSPSAWSSER